uniref:DUF4371 domain-containing protein n=1 Tax=Octopus bimaculoides TaxID=37653 RepID=A0A0L8I5Z8_OCTBM
MQDGIAHYEQNEILKILKKQKFSLLIDEIVCFFDEQLLNVKDALLDAIVLENSLSRGLYDAVKSTLTKEDVSMSNILGFASDNCSTMIGNKSGFQKLLRNDISTVFTIGCVCHSFALCSSHAVKMLPSYLKFYFKGLNFLLFSK